MQSLFDSSTVRRLVASLGLFGFIACGSEEPAEVQGFNTPPPATEAAAAPADPPQRDDASAPVRVRRENNSAPVIASVEFDPPNPTTGETVRAVVDVSDADGDPPFLSYEWSLGGRPVGNGVSKLVLHDARKGDRLELEVVASDGQDESASETIWVKIENAAPTLKKVEIEPGAEISAGQTITLRPDARDRDGDPVSFSYEWTVNGERMPEEGPTFETGELKRGDEVLAVVVASDGEIDSLPLETPAFVLTNTPPQITSWPGAPGEDGVFEYQVQAEDADGTANLMYKLEKAPPGMQIDPKSGHVRWQPKPEQLGSYSIAIIVDDLEGGQAKQVFELSTTPPDGDSAPPASPE
jgi:hypothetical protein